jgi:hypothetical protein
VSLDSSIQERLAVLPPTITRAEIAFLAGVTEFAVAKWVRRPGFPQPVDPTERRYRYRTDVVVVWLADHVQSERSRLGQQLRRSPSRLSLSDPRYLKDAEIAKLLDVNASVITDYARRYQDSDTPFPARLEDGCRSVAEVARWFKDHQPKRGRGPAAGLARSAAGTADQQRELVAERFALLSKRCVFDDIVQATGAAESTVAHWRGQHDFPSPVSTRPARGSGGKPRFEYSTAAVARWCLSRMFDQISD